MIPRLVCSFSKYRNPKERYVLTITTGRQSTLASIRGLKGGGKDIWGKGSIGYVELV